MGTVTREGNFNTLLLVAIPDTVFNLGEKMTGQLRLFHLSQFQKLQNLLFLFHSQAVNLSPLQLPPVIPAVPSVNQAHPCRTALVSRPPGEWWKVKHAAKPEAEAPVIWSDEEEDPGDGQQISVSGQEPRNFKQAMQDSQSDRWRDAALLEYNTLVKNST